MRGAHKHGFILHKQIDALDEFDAHLLRQECMFKVGRIEVTRRHQHDSRAIHSDRGRIAQRLQQHVRVVINRPNGLRSKQFRKQAHHHLAIFKKIRHARWRTEIVFEHVIFAVCVLYQINARNVCVDSAGHVNVHHFGTKLTVSEHLIGRNFSRLQNFLIVVDIVEEGIECCNTLGQPKRDFLPLFPRDDVRHDVEGDEALRAGALAVNGKSNSDAVKH